MDKRTLSERDICTKYGTPAVQAAGWNVHTQMGEEVSFTRGRVIVRGGSGRSPRYYQLTAINRAVEAVARGQNSLLLVMATGTGRPPLTRKVRADQVGSVTTSHVTARQRVRC
jgi:type I site-specific restriction endonuclease